ATARRHLAVGEHPPRRRPFPAGRWRRPAEPVEHVAGIACPAMVRRIALTINAPYGKTRAREAANVFSLEGFFAGHLMANPKPPREEAAGQSSAESEPMPPRRHARGEGRPAR